MGSALLITGSLCAWACSTTPPSSAAGDSGVQTDAAGADAAAGEAGNPDARPDRAPLDASCDARIAACPSRSSADYSTTIDPVACAAPPYDQYNTGTGVEQVEAGCSDFCFQINDSTSRRCNLNV